MSSQRAGGVLVLRDAVFRAHRAQIVALAAKSRLPAVYGLREEAEAGGLMAYGASVRELGIRGVDRPVYGKSTGLIPSTVGACTMKRSMVG